MFKTYRKKKHSNNKFLSKLHIYHVFQTSLLRKKTFRLINLINDHDIVQ